MTFDLGDQVFARSDRRGPRCHPHHVIAGYAVYRKVCRRTRATRTFVSYRHHLSQTNGIDSRFVSLSRRRY